MSRAGGTCGGVSGGLGREEGWGSVAETPSGGEKKEKEKKKKALLFLVSALHSGSLPTLGKHERERTRPYAF